MEQFLKESVKVEVSLYKHAGVSKAKMRDEVKALFEMHQTDGGVMLEEAVGEKIAQKVVSKVLSSIDRDIKSVRIIIEARKKKGLSTSSLEDKLKSLEGMKKTIADNRAAAEMSVPKMASTLISYAKTIVAIVGVCAGFLGLAVGAVTASKFGLDGLRKSAEVAFKGAKASAGGGLTGKGADVATKMLGGTPNVSNLKSYIKALKNSNASAREIAKAENALKVLSDGTKAQAQGAWDSLLKGQFKDAGKGAMGAAKSAGKAAGTGASIATEKAKGAAADAQLGAQGTALMSNLMKIVAVAIVVSLLLVVVSKIMVNVYAGRLKNEAAKSMMEKAVNKSAGQSSSQAKQVK